MTEQDKQKFATAMGAIAETWKEPLSGPRLNAYFLALEDLSIEDVEIGIRLVLRDHKFGFPLPATIREAVAGSGSDRATLAWDTFKKLCIEEGHYPSLQITDGALAFAIEHLGGWIAAQAKLAEAEAPMVRAYENQFKDAYKLGEKRGAKPQYFLGHYEYHNRTSGRTACLGDGKDEGARREFLLPVCHVRGDGYQVLSLPFDLAAGRIETKAMAQLTAGDVQSFLPQTVPVRSQFLLTGQNETGLTPEEISQIPEVLEIRAKVERFLTGAVHDMDLRRRGQNGIGNNEERP